MKARILPLDSAEHRSAQELLPWFVNGTLDAAEASSVGRHIAGCGSYHSAGKTLSRAPEKPAAIHSERSRCILHVVAPE